MKCSNCCAEVGVTHVARDNGLSYCTICVRAHNIELVLPLQEQAYLEAELAKGASQDEPMAVGDVQDVGLDESMMDKVQDDLRPHPPSKDSVHPREAAIEDAFLHKTIVETRRILNEKALEEADAEAIEVLETIAKSEEHLVLETEYNQLRRAVRELRSIMFNNTSSADERVFEARILLRHLPA